MTIQEQLRAPPRKNLTSGCNISPAIANIPALRPKFELRKQGDKFMQTVANGVYNRANGRSPPQTQRSP